MPITKFAVTILPLIILGYILGWCLSAMNSGWDVFPAIPFLAFAGIVLALWRCKEVL